MSADRPSRARPEASAGASARRRLPAAERRAAILAAARGAFAREGFHGAGTADIAAAADCSEAILYRHFSSKRELFLEVLRAEVGGRVSEGRAIAPPRSADGASPLPQVLAARLADPEAITTIRLIVLALGMSDDPEIAAAIQDSFALIRGPLRAAIEAGQAGGQVRSDLDPEAVTWLWHGLFLLAMVRRAAADDGVADGAVPAAAALAGLLRPPAGG